MKKLLFLLVIPVGLFSCALGGGGSLGAIKIDINQIGFYINGPKTFIVCTGSDTVIGTDFEVRDATDTMVYPGTLADAGTWTDSDDVLHIGDFSAWTTPGQYHVYVEGVGDSHTFQIGDDLFYDALKAAIKSFYYQRASMALTATYAGAWPRAAGHPDTNCTLHSSTGASGTISSPGGWYDAGDYGKYIVNGGVTVGTMLSLYELYPALIGNDLNIPESANSTSDLLDEIRYELEWFKTMQDSDGGVYFKLGPLSWPGFVMPAADSGARYVIGKSTTGTLNFAACMAQAARVYQSIDGTFAADCLTRAQSAWTWANANPAVDEPSETGGTGGYGDSSPYDDEFFWAAAELAITTENDTYLALYSSVISNPTITGPANWQNVKNLGYFSLATNPDTPGSIVTTNIENAITGFADSLIAKINANPYRIPMNGNEFYWGSNGTMANFGIVPAYAYALTADQQYLDACVSTLDYLFGKSATGFTAITGVGDKSPRNPHHRESVADGISAPVPGLVTGGPNQAQNDLGQPGVVYPTNEPAKCFIDIYQSYASNEPAINQNAAVIFLIGFVEANNGVYE